MLSNALRSVCRLRNAQVFDNHYGSLVGLSKLQHAAIAVSAEKVSTLERLLLTPSVLPLGESNSPSSYSIRLDSPLSSLGSPLESTTTQWSLEDEKSFDCKHGIYELDSLLSDDVGDFETDEAIQSCSEVVEKAQYQTTDATEEEDDYDSFHAFIDDLIVTVKEEIKSELALEMIPNIPRSGADCVALVEKQHSKQAIPGVTAKVETVIKEANSSVCPARKRLLSDSCDVPPLRKRKRIFSLEEMALRKRNQNRRAAQKYREKMMKLKSEQAEECTELEEKNFALREDIKELEEEIQRFKGLLLVKAQETRANTQ